MGEIRINANDEKILSALKAGITKRQDLVRATKLSKMQVRRNLEKLTSIDYRLVKRIRKGHYELTEEGQKRERKQQAKSDKMLHIGEDFLGKISSYIKNKVPVGFQSPMRLMLCEMHSRQSPEIFDNPAHASGYSSVILVSEPKLMKSPIIEAICKMRGLNFEELKFVVGATKRETIGEWKNLPDKGMTFIPAPQLNKEIVILEDFGDILKRKDTREGVLILAHGDRSFRKGEQIIPQHCVPFITFNTRTETISENINEIERILGTEYIKRSILVNANFFASSLEDSPILTRKMLSKIPRLNFNAFPVEKTKLTDKEFGFMYNILKKATISKKRKLYDERSIGRRILSRYALSKNENIIDSIFQTCIDELARLETLNVTVEDWRAELIKHWKQARPDNLELKKIWQEEEKRIKESEKKEAEKQKERLEEIEKEKDKKLNEEVVFNADYKRELDKMKRLLLDSKGIPDFINRRTSLNKEYQDFKKGNWTEKFKQLKRRVLYWERDLEPYKIKHEKEALAFVNRKGKLEADLKQLKSELPSPQMKADEWGNKQIPIRRQINTVLDWLNEVRTEDDLQTCESRYLDVKSDWEDFMYKYRAWGKKEEEEKRQKEQASQALKVRKDELAEPFQDLRKWFNRFRLKEEKSIVEKAKKLTDTIIKEIQGAEDLEQLKEMERYPTLEERLGLARETKNVKISLSMHRDELEEKLGLLEERRTLIREMQNYKERLKKFDRDEEKDEVREKNQALEDLLSKIYQTESNGDLISLKSDLTIFKQKLDSLIVSLEQRRAQQKTREEDREQVRKEQVQIQNQINKLQKEKERIEEQLNKDIFRKEDLSPQEKAIFERLEGYRERKTAPTNDLSSFFERLTLIKRVKSSDKIQTGPNKDYTIQHVFGKSYLDKFGQDLPLELYLTVDDHVFPLNYFQDWDWDQAKITIEWRIDQFRSFAKQRRNEKLKSQWSELNKQQQRLKSPLYYVRTDRRLIRYKYREEKKEGFHFHFEGHRVWRLPKGKGWTVCTKLEYEGELFSFVSDKKSTIVVQRDGNRREISKAWVFSYIYEYKGSEPS